MKDTKKFFIFTVSLSLMLFSIPSAFADVEFVGVDIFCPFGDELLAFTDIVPFLEMCPISFVEQEDVVLIKLSPVQTTFDPQKIVDSKTTLLKLDIQNTFSETKNCPNNPAI